MFSQFETIALMILTITQAILLNFALEAFFEIKGIIALIICLVVGFIISSCELTILHNLKNDEED